MTDTIAPIDAQTAFALLEAAVQLGNEDHVYEAPNGVTCKYVDGDNPSCLVGVALDIHGVPLGVMRGWDAAPDDASIINVAADFLDEDARRVFSAAQAVQDNGVTASFELRWCTTWGHALAAAQSALDDLNT